VCAALSWHRGRMYTYYYPGSGSEDQHKTVVS
jgi:hypothetical protein